MTVRPLEIEEIIPIYVIGQRGFSPVYFLVFPARRNSEGAVVTHCLGRGKGLTLLVARPVLRVACVRDAAYKTGPAPGATMASGKAGFWPIDL